METLEVQTPYPITTTTIITTVGHDDYDDDVSPIEQVRLTVTNTDDPTLPVWTFRMWFLGILSCSLLSFLNQFFNNRTEPLIITQITIQVAVLPIGHFLHAVLPKARFRSRVRIQVVFSQPGPI
ncbi:Oligopeptide transporter 4 [Camellia lanceoleosa]|uniref:Oligopeptide transporter 4 n=1 Tax=Camellia lanceoleosa TaxID=1840588 RepID=A0ACC0FU96_9ERIC|nr:Oligopeptide transporter 4 [Camellia lanceoleosa]